ncbi:hypothetical protein LCGC14_0861280 [marine sediment metagenome]|uniref:Uncharacterized protein n=1 Tax=marine sediment metagenome TaxID=412755 RepID=A0A0F9SEI2_9ZZZZ
MARKLITAVLSESELKALRAVPFIQRNKIIQDKLNQKMKTRIMQLRAEEEKRKKEKFIF